MSGVPLALAVLATNLQAHKKTAAVEFDSS
jgi:hypothetical protein